MKRLLSATLLCLSLFAVGSAQQTETLTNAGVIKLVKAGFKEKTIITIIGNRPSDFKLDTEDLIVLKRNGVNENIIMAMLSSHMGTVIVSNEDDWENDGGASIFGSGASSKSDSRSRGALGGNQNEGNVTGSATVRIIKSPAEGGENTAAKLERSPTLNNEGVIRMVDAGFSEGTIIKRIQESPVEFDLSPGKLEELFKKRVTDAIIAAMREAMGDK
jgi:hypothetical protein